MRTSEHSVHLKFAGARPVEKVDREPLVTAIRRIGHAIRSQSGCTEVPFRWALLALATSFAADKGFAKPPNGHDGRVDAHDRHTDVDLEILDLLREGPKSAYRLAGALTHAGEEVGLEAMRSRLKALATRGLVVGSASGHLTAAGGAEAPLADPWRITEEGRALVEPEARVARAPYDREVGAEEEGGRDAGFWVLITIAVVTAACAAYSLLVATGVLGGT